MKTIISALPNNSIHTKSLDTNNKHVIVCVHKDYNYIYLLSYLPNNKYHWHPLFYISTTSVIYDTSHLPEDFETWIRCGWNIYLFDSPQEMRDWLTEFLANNKKGVNE